MSGARSARLLLLAVVCAAPLAAQAPPVMLTIAGPKDPFCEGAPAAARQAIFTVTAMPLGMGQSVDVDFGIAMGGSATEGTDFQVLTPAPLTIFGDVSGVGTGEIVVEVLDDPEPGETPPETFFVELRPIGAPPPPPAQATILDDDSSLSIVSPMAVVEGDAAAFTVSLAPQSCAAVQVTARAGDGSGPAAATAADNDYQPTIAMLTFLPGETSKPFSVQTVPDSKLEEAESFVAALSSPSGATIAVSEALATIANDDTVTVSIGDALFFEDDAGASSVSVAVQLSEPAGVPVSVAYATRDGTATEGSDYRGASGRVELPAGQALGKLLVPVLGDTTVEPDESFFVDLSAPQPTGAVIGDGEALVIIRNDDAEGPGTLRLGPLPAVGEADGSATITVERTGGASGPAAVDLTTADRTATAGSDYRSRSRTLRWASGEAGLRTVDVPILDDAEDEPDERFTVRLANAVGAALGSPFSGEVVIRDDDQPMLLEPVGETSRGGRIEERLRFEALARRADGAPVAGATVFWTAAGDGELVGARTTTTGVDGVAGVEVLLGRRPGRVTITAVIPGTSQSVSFEVEIEGDLDTLFDPAADPEESAIAGLINEACRGPAPALGEICDVLFDLERSEQRTLIAELVPREAGALADLLLRSPEAQLMNLRRHLAARRAGGGAGNQITLAFDGGALPLGSLRVAISGRRVTEERLAAGIAAAMLRGVGEEPEAPAAAPAEIDAESRLGFFASGQVDVGDRPGSRREAGFELDTTGLTLGLDYRLRPRLVLGAALGLVETDAPIDGGAGAGGGGVTGLEGESISLFLTRFGDKLWLDAIVDYGRADLETARNLDLPTAFGGQRRLVARARPGASRLAAELGGGYDASLGATTVGLFGRLSWIDAELDGYTETGAGPFNLTIAAQRIESLLLEAGLELLYASSQRWGVLQPSLRASVLHEFEDDSRLLTAGFAADPAAGRFRVATDPPDRDYLRLGAGLTATFPRGRALYLNYDADLERDDLDLTRLSGGLRLAF